MTLGQIGLRQLILNMSLVLNPLTGSLDYVEIPTLVQTNTPTLMTDGDVRIVFLNGNAYIYWRSQGVTYSAQGVQG